MRRSHALHRLMKLSPTVKLCLLLSVCSAAELKSEKLSPSSSSSTDETDRPKVVQETYYQSSRGGEPKWMYTRTLKNSGGASPNTSNEFEAVEKSFKVPLKEEGEDEDRSSEASEVRELRFIKNGKLNFPLVRLALERRKDWKDHTYSESILQSLPPIANLALPSFEELPETELADRGPASINERERRILACLIDPKYEWTLVNRVPLFEFAFRMRQNKEFGNYAPVLLKRMAQELDHLKEVGLAHLKEHNEMQKELIEQLQAIIAKLEKPGLVQMKHGRADKLKEEYLAIYQEAVKMKNKFLRANWLQAIKEIEFIRQDVNVIIRAVREKEQEKETPSMKGGDQDDISI